MIIWYIISPVTFNQFFISSQSILSINQSVSQSIKWQFSGAAWWCFFSLPAWWTAVKVTAQGHSSRSRLRATLSGERRCWECSVGRGSEPSGTFSPSQRRRRSHLFIYHCSAETCKWGRAAPLRTAPHRTVNRRENGKRRMWCESAAPFPRT